MGLTRGPRMKGGFKDRSKNGSKNKNGSKYKGKV